MKEPDNPVRSEPDGGSGLIGRRGQIIDDLEDPARGRAALAAVFDGPTVTDLRLYALGDGGQLAGVEVAARLADDRGLFLVLLLD